MKDKPLFAFFGTPTFAVHVLDALESRGFVPALVITAPDKPAGRGHKLTPAPAKVWAKERDIDVVTPATLKDEAFVAELANTEWDIFIVAAYGKLIPKSIFDMPKHKTLNVHPSLLPKFRGPSPVISAILEDERQTGVTIMQLAEEMDAGPIVAQARVEIAEGDWPLSSATLSEMLFTEGGSLLAEVMPEWIAGTITPEPQDEALATFTKKFEPSDALIDIDGDPRVELLKIRAFDTNPRAHFVKDSKHVIITDAEVRDNKLELLKVIPEGKKEMDYQTFLRHNGAK